MVDIPLWNKEVGTDVTCTSRLFKTSSIHNFHWRTARTLYFDEFCQQGSSSCGLGYHGYHVKCLFICFVYGCVFWLCSAEHFCVKLVFISFSIYVVKCSLFVKYIHHFHSDYFAFILWFANIACKHPNAIYLIYESLID